MITAVWIRKNNLAIPEPSFVRVAIDHQPGFCRFVVVISGDKAPLSYGFCDHIVYLSYLMGVGFKNECGDKNVDWR